MIYKGMGFFFSHTPFKGLGRRLSSWLVQVCFMPLSENQFKYYLHICRALEGAIVLWAMGRERRMEVSEWGWQWSA